MKLTLGDEAFYFRSRGLFVFLNLLKDAHPNWVNLAAVYLALPNTTPRQIARYIDLLEAAGLHLVEFETKTKGKFKLAVTPQNLQLPMLHLEKVEMQVVKEKSQSRVHKHKTLLSDYLNSDWLIWLQGLLQGHLALMDGHLCAQQGALLHLNTALQTAENLPVWTKSIVYARLAHAYTRKCEFAEAKKWLKRAETIERTGLAHPALAVRLCVLRAKLSYDQGDYISTQKLLNSKPLSHAESPQIFSMQALLYGRQCVDDASNGAVHLQNAFELLSLAIGGVMLWQEDTSILDALTYNFGNIMLRAVRLQIIDRQYADLAAQWLASNIMVCRKLGVGEDSVLSDLLLFDILYEYKVDYKNWPNCLKGGHFIYDKMHILERAKDHARTQNNLLELAECLRRQMWIADDEQSPTYYAEALSILEAIKRPDIVDELKNEFVVCSHQNEICRVGRL